MNIKEINKAKKIVNLLKKEIIEIDAQLYYKGKKEYLKEYRYAQPFIVDFKNINVFTKNLLTNREVNENIYLNDYLVDAIKEKYGLNIRQIDCLTSKKYFDYIAEKAEEGDEYCINKLKVIIDNFYKGNA